MGEFGESRFHESLKQHESKVRLLKTHSHNSDRRGHQAGENAKKNEKEGGLGRQGPANAKHRKPTTTSRQQRKGEGGGRGGGTRCSCIVV